MPGKHCSPLAAVERDALDAKPLAALRNHWAIFLLARIAPFGRLAPDSHDEWLTLSMRSNDGSQL